MSLLHALILGIVQGLTEFLPISSSAHLMLVPKVLGWPEAESGLAFDVALHIGTLVALAWYFSDEWIRLAGEAWSIVQKRRIETPGERRVVAIVIATIPGVLAGLLLQDWVETVFRNAPRANAAALIVFGILLWAADRFCKSTRDLDGLRWSDALLLGLAQACALFPGVSRSGATITAGRSLGFSRESAAVFSFLMALPITAGAALKEVPQLLHAPGMAAPLAVGILASAISGWLAIAVLLRYVARHSYGAFAIYRIVAGILVLVLLGGRA